MQILLFLVHAFLKSFQIKWQLVEKVYKHTFNAIFDFNDTLTEASKMTNWRSRTHTHTYTHSLTYTHTYSLTHALTHAYTLDHTHTLTHAHSHTYIHESLSSTPVLWYLYSFCSQCCYTPEQSVWSCIHCCVHVLSYHALCKVNQICKFY